ncbi:HTH-type transcriptional regulator PgrR [Ephemeroptericola cinctiostellae]|uniref:HTH-type transcriptional regulator PgrR n=1 Tax=Ephemeroptericola cinctiostellae TaxID=2268024 RepID=A0A345DB50_9BURK|nr:LysR family transcriptional regulator [Ephemeroptericola cinctiostellae]AXF85588.1 HTH-type transcriptional regulator PgrR [Ephemeroptericola cinctiostellae]
MKHIDLNLLIKFIAVCDTGSFTAAAEQLGVAKSILSEHITRLEKDLGVQLLARSTRKLKITEAGQTVLNAARLAIEQLHTTVQTVQEAHHQLAGKIRLTSSLDYSNCILTRQLADFSKRHPNIDIEVIASDEQYDLLSAQLDVSIRVGWLMDSSHKAIRIGQMKQKLVASPAYLAQHGTPTTPSDITQHNWLTLTALSNAQWTFTRDQTQQVIRPAGHLRANATLVIYQWLLLGMGISVLPDYQLQGDIDAGRLVALLPDWHLPDGGIYAVYPANKHLPQRVRALIDFLQSTSTQ